MQNRKDSLDSSWWTAPRRLFGYAIHILLPDRLTRDFFLQDVIQKNPKALRIDQHFLSAGVQPKEVFIRCLSSLRQRLPFFFKEDERNLEEEERIFEEILNHLFSHRTFERTNGHHDASTSMVIILYIVLDL